MEMSWNHGWKMGLQKHKEIKRNLDAVIVALPSWGQRINEHDRNLLIQAMADLELLHAAIVGGSNNEMVRDGVKKFLKPARILNDG